MWYDGYNFIRKLTFRKIFNYLTLKISYVLSILIRKPLIWGYPAVATIEPTNRCNLKCVECPTGNNSLTRTKGYIDPALFQQLINSLAPNLTWLMLYFQGEPLLHKHLTGLIRYASDKNIYTSISTNGHQLTKENARWLIDSGLDRIIISLDGIDQETYSKYRQGGNFKTVITGIKNLVNLKDELKSRKPYIMLQVIVMKHNEEHINNIKLLGKSLGVDKTVFKTMQVTDFKKHRHFLPLNKKYARYSLTENQDAGNSKNLVNRCWRIWSTLVILHDGVSVPCCFDKDARYPLGIFPVTNLRSIWMGNSFKKFRKEILVARNNFPICCNCTEGMKKVYI